MKSHELREAHIKSTGKEPSAASARYVGRRQRHMLGIAREMFEVRGGAVPADDLIEVYLRTSDNDRTTKFSRQHAEKALIHLIEGRFLTVDTRRPDLDEEQRS